MASLANESTRNVGSACACTANGALKASRTKSLRRYVMIAELLQHPLHARCTGVNREQRGPASGPGIHPLLLGLDHPLVLFGERKPPRGRDRFANRKVVFARSRRSVEPNRREVVVRRAPVLRRE